MQPQQQAARLALERQQHRAVVGEDEPQRLARLARERRLERRLLPAGRLLERERELPCRAHGKPIAMRMAQRRPLVKRTRGSRTRRAAACTVPRELSVPVVRFTVRPQSPSRKPSPERVAPLVVEP